MNWASVTCRVQGLDVHSFLARLLAEGIPPRGVQRAGFAVQLTVPARHYRRLARIARSLGGKSRVIARRGLYFPLRGILSRAGVFFGAVVFGIGVVCSQQYVWCIRCPGMEPYQSLPVRAALVQAGIREGSRFTDALAHTGQTLLMGQGGFGWVSLNFEKGRLVVETAPAAPVPEIASPAGQDLTAAVQAVVTGVQVDAGTAMVRPGDSVLPGAVLIAAARPDREGKPVPGRAAGRVTGRFFVSRQWQQPLPYEVRLPVGRQTLRRSLFVLGHTLHGPGRAPGPGSQTQYRPVSVLGFALPASWAEDTAPGEKTAAGILTESLARAKARKRCRDDVHTQWDMHQVIQESENFYVEGQVLFYGYRAEIEADITGKK